MLCVDLCIQTVFPQYSIFKTALSKKAMLYAMITLTQFGQNAVMSVLTKFFLD